MKLQEILVDRKVAIKGILLFFLLNLLDTTTTVALLKLAEINNIVAAELNPIPNYFLSLGYGYFIFFKVSFGIIICGALYLITRIKQIPFNIINISLIITNSLYVSVVSCMIIRAIIVALE